MYISLPLAQLNGYKHKDICVNGHINIHLNDFRCLCISVSIYVCTQIYQVYLCAGTELCVCPLAGGFLFPVMFEATFFANTTEKCLA